MVAKTTWTQSHKNQLQEVYSVSTWLKLLDLFPFSTKRGIQAQANKLGLAKTNRANNAYLAHKEDLFDKWTEESAYLLGYLEADGHIHWNEKSVNVSFYASIKDRDYIEKLKKLCGFNGKTCIKRHLVKGKKYKTIGFTVTSRSWKSFFDKHFRKGTIPEDIPKKLLSHYIRGYFDGDGSIYFEKNRIMVSFVGNSKSYLIKLRNTIANILKDSRGMSVYQKTNSDKCWYFRVAKQELVGKFGIWIYQNANIHLDRKRNRFRRILPSVIIQKFVQL